KTFGNNVADWRWGDAHQAQHDHTILGGRALFSWLFNIRQPVSGGDNTLNMGQMSGLGEHPYRSLQGASYRGIYDFSDLDASRFVLSTGQSGHPFSRHFDDQSQLWKAGGYAIMSLDPVFARANSVGIMTLEPARE
ncbi:MAG: penicillin acylase family protein, partial [Rhodobacteraceae bacterium]|nr:penicillin acylase family protein [Paracoccaceae bacterium]